MEGGAAEGERAAGELNDMFETSRRGGRRYLDPVRDDTAVVTPGDGGASARAVVSSVAPLFAAAHIRSVNLECVIGTFPLAAAYPKKRFLLQSPPEALDLLDELRANLVTLGNNHVRDWLEPGLASTLDHLDGAGIARVGAGLDEAEAALSRTVAAASRVSTVNLRS